MASILNGSIDLTKIDKSKIKTVTKKDGTTAKYLDVSIFINDEQDSYQNIASMTIGQSKEEREAKAPKVYLGNLKRTWASSGEPITTAKPQTNQTTTSENDLF